MQLPYSIRESLVDDIDEFLEAFSSDPEPEQVATYMIEQLETYADDEGIDDIVPALEENGGLESSLQETLEQEMAANEEFEFTGEEIVSLLERLCDIVWDDDDEDDEDEEDDEDDDEDEEEDLDEDF